MFDLNFLYLNIGLGVRFLDYKFVNFYRLNLKKIYEDKF